MNREGALGKRKLELGNYRVMHIRQRREAIAASLLCYYEICGLVYPMFLFQPVVAAVQLSVLATGLIRTRPVPQ